METESSEILTRKIEALANTNNEIIERIQHMRNLGQMKIDQEKHIIVFQMQENPIIVDYANVISEWRVPSSAKKPIDVDPAKILYGEEKSLMDIQCETFDDLVRINSQVKVALRYTTILKETASISFGQKFKENFENVHVLLGMLETSLIDKESKLQELQSDFNNVHAIINQILNKYPMINSVNSYHLCYSWDTSVNSEHITYSNGRLATQNDLCYTIRTNYFSEGNHTIKIKAIQVGHVGIGYCAKSKNLDFGNWLGSDYISGGLWDTGLYPGKIKSLALKKDDIITVNINFNEKKINIYQSNNLIPTNFSFPNEPIAFAASLWKKK